MKVMDSPGCQDIMARCLGYLPHSKTGDYKYVGLGDGVFYWFLWYSNGRWVKWQLVLYGQFESVYSI
jgi:hypothetical protein